jgi:diguanylate cyclase (GGDEF)-like protein/PAS domain S-box-containing protein
MTEYRVEWSLELLQAVLDSATEGVVVCEAGGDQRVVYINPAFAELCGFPPREIIGSTFSRLQPGDLAQEGVAKLRDAVARTEACRVVVRNFRKDGSAFWNEISLRPLRGAGGRVTHFAAYYRETAERPRAVERPATGLPSWIRDDRLTGLATRAYFDEVLQREWTAAQRVGHVLTLFNFDIDYLSAYNDTFQKGGGDSCIRRVAHVIGGAFRRSTDFVARIEGGAFQVLVRGMAGEAAESYAREVAQRVFDLHIHHPRATSRYVTVSVGIANLVPPRGVPPLPLLQAAEAALERAKTGGRHRVVIADNVSPAAAGCVPAAPSPPSFTVPVAAHPEPA